MHQTYLLHLPPAPAPPGEIADIICMNVCLQDLPPPTYGSAVQTPQTTPPLPPPLVESAGSDEVHKAITAAREFIAATSRGSVTNDGDAGAGAEILDKGSENEGALPDTPPVTPPPSTSSSSHGFFSCAYDYSEDVKEIDGGDDIFPADAHLQASRGDKEGGRAHGQGGSE